MSEPFVVKAQCSIVSTGNPTVLVYDNSHQIESEFPATKSIIKSVGDRSFWWAVVNDKKVVELSHQASEADFKRFDFPTMNLVDKEQ